MSTKITIILTIILTAAITLIPSCLMLRHQSAELERAHGETEALRSEMTRVTSEIDAATKRLDAAIQHYTKGIEDAHKDHENRMSEITRMENAPETRDWMCEPVPDDVCLLFDSGTMFAD